MKIVVNYSYGGFGLSDIADKILRYERNGSYERNNPELVKIVEELGRRAEGNCARLVIEEIPDDATDYFIYDDDGYETLIYVKDGKICFV